MSFSGMGGSDWRERYAIAQWVAEAQAAAEGAGLFEADTGAKPWVVAHSFGGFALMSATARWGQRMAGAMIVDAPLRPREQREAREAERRRRKLQPTRVYWSVEEALGRFRFLPPQRCEHLYIVDHIARCSLREVEGGVSWRFDPFLFRDFDYGHPYRELHEARCPVLLVRGGRSRLVTPELMAYALSKAPPGTRSAEVPDADHHVMVDQPLAFAELLTATVSGR
jgi:pimeloyl-ACP methyl ester carboxylesterase